MEKQWLVPYGIACMYGCPAVIRRTMGTCDRDPRSSQVFEQEAVLANRKFSGDYAWSPMWVLFLSPSAGPRASRKVYLPRRGPCRVSIHGAL